LPRVYDACPPGGQSRCRCAPGGRFATGTRRAVGFARTGRRFAGAVLLRRTLCRSKASCAHPAEESKEAAEQAGNVAARTITYHIKLIPGPIDFISPVSEFRVVGRGTRCRGALSPLPRWLWRLA